jgi:hypothetical protein
MFSEASDHLDQTTRSRYYNIPRSLIVTLLGSMATALHTFSVKQDVKFTKQQSKSGAGGSRL